MRSAQPTFYLFFKLGTVPALDLSIKLQIRFYAYFLVLSWPLKPHSDYVSRDAIVKGPPRMDGDVAVIVANSGKVEMEGRKWQGLVTSKTFREVA